MLKLYKWMPMGGLLFVAFTQTYLHAQRVSFGGHGGFALGVFRSLGNEVLQAGTIPGPTVGVNLNIRLLKRLVLQPEISFVNSRGSSVLNLYRKSIRQVNGVPIPVDVRIRVNSKVTFYNLEMPLLLRYSYVSKDQYQMYIFGGPSFTWRMAYTIGGNVEVNVKGIPFQDISPQFGESDPPINDQTEVLVSNQPIGRDSVRYRPWDVGLTLGMGTAVHLKYGTFTMGVRYNNNFMDLNVGPVRNGKLYSGSVQVLFGYEFGRFKRKGQNPKKPPVELSHAVMKTEPLNNR